MLVKVWNCCLTVWCSAFVCAPDHCFILHFAVSVCTLSLDILKFCIFLMWSHVTKELIQRTTCVLFFFQVLGHVHNCLFVRVLSRSDLCCLPYLSRGCLPNQLACVSSSAAILGNVFRVLDHVFTREWKQVIQPSSRDSNHNINIMPCSVFYCSIWPAWVYLHYAGWHCWFFSLFFY